VGGDEGKEARDGADVRIPPPILYLVAVALGIALHHWAWELGFAPGSGARVVLGLALTCGGVAILSSAFTVFRRIGQHPDPRKPTPTISRDGPYRYTRNPMYVAGNLIQLGVGVALGNSWIVMLLIPVTMIIHYGAILPEERYLERKFGEEYYSFKASVRRWI
jgi:protein-S-isoprenylcysteine O-methyltransferase Ste14